MKKLFFSLLILLLSCWNTILNAQNDIAGTWEGKLTIGTNSLRIVFHFDKQNDGLYSGSMDSPDQGAAGIHCDEVTVKNDSVIVGVKVINGGFSGLMGSDSVMDGNWVQNGMKIPVVLRKMKTEKKMELNRDSNCVETKITLETKTGTIFGTLCTPKDFINGPVALIIAGSGPTDRNCNSAMGFKTDAYKILAHKLAEQHIATVRYDKRGIGESAAALTNEPDLTFDDFVNDAVDWIEMLKADKCFTNVIVIGHSEGSLIGMIAAKRAGADKYISIAGAGESIDKILKTQLSAQPKSVQDSAFPIIDSLKAGKIVKHVEPLLYSLFRPGIQPFILSWMKYDPAVEISKLTIPVLIIQGTNDIQISVDDAKKLSEADKNAKLVLLQNMNHIFRVVEGDRQANFATYNNPALPIDPKLVATIADFINKR